MSPARGLVALLLMGCVESEVRQAPPPGAGGLALSGPDLVHAGSTVTWTVRAYDLQPGRRVHLGWGGAVGSGPCIPAAGLCVDLLSPRPIASTMTTPLDSDPSLGEAVFELQVPARATADEVWLQALMIDGADSATSPALRVEIVDADCDLQTGLCDGEQPGLIAHWPLDDRLGDVAADVGEHGLQGQILGAPWVDCDGVRVLDRIDDRVVVPDDARLDLSHPMTVSAWVRTPAFLPITQRFVSKSLFGSENGWELSLSSTGVPFVRFNQASLGNAARVDARGLLWADTWTHLAFSWDGRMLRLYVDGALAGQTPVSEPPGVNGADLGIGSAGNGDRPVRGSVSDVRLYRGALPAGEVALLADRSAIASWSLEDGADAHPDGRDLSLSGSATWAGDHLLLDGGGHALVGSRALSPARGFVARGSVRPDRVGTQRILSKQQPNTVDGWELSLSATGTVFARFNQTTSGNRFRVDSTTAYPTDGRWMDVELRYDGALLSLVVDGVVEDAVETAAGATVNALPLVLGADPGGAAALHGAIRDVSIERLERGCADEPVHAVVVHTPLDEAAPTGARPQSKVFEHGGDGFAVLAAADGTWIWRLEDTTWTREHLLSPSTTAAADVLVDGDVVHALLFDGASTEVVTAVAGLTGWEPWPVAGSIPLVLPPDAETATMAKDGLGRLWVSWEAGGEVHVAWADAPFSAFVEVPPLAVGLDPDDITAITAVDGGVGVLWSNQNAQRFGFRVHLDGDDTDQWSVDEVPASHGPWWGLAVNDGFADDHINLALHEDGRLFAAVKTGYDLRDHPTVMLLVREVDGIWHPADDDHRVDLSTAQARPGVWVSADELVVAYTDRSGIPSIRYRTSAIDTLAFGPEQQLFGGFGIDDVSGARAPYGDELVLLGSDGLQVRGVTLQRW